MPNFSRLFELTVSSYVEEIGNVISLIGLITITIFLICGGIISEFSQVPEQIAQTCFSITIFVGFPTFIVGIICRLIGICMRPKNEKIHDHADYVSIPDSYFAMNIDDNPINIPEDS